MESLATLLLVQICAFVTFGTCFIGPRVGRKWQWPLQIVYCVSIGIAATGVINLYVSMFIRW